MPKPHLRRALAASCLILAAPASAQSLGQRIADAQAAAHRVEWGREAYREQQAQSEAAGAEAERARRAENTRVIIAFAQRVRPYCVDDADSLQLTAAGLRTKRQGEIAVIVCALDQERRAAIAAEQAEETRKHPTLMEQARAAYDPPRP